jgi:four helix bundle protein
MPAPVFHVLEVAHSIVPLLKSPLEQLARRNPSLTDQLRRAVESIPSNIAEGNRRVGRDRLHHWRLAAGSADEVRTALRIAIGWGHAAADDVAPALEACDRVLAMLWRLTAPRPS